MSNDNGGYCKRKGKIITNKADQIYRTKKKVTKRMKTIKDKENMGKPAIYNELELYHNL